MTAAPTYEVRLGGHLDPRWSDWFGGLALAHGPGPSTTLTGPVADQAALHGLLQTARDLGLPLLSVRVLPAPPGSRTTRRRGERP